MIKHRRDLWQLLVDRFGKTGPVAEIGVAEGLNSRDILSPPWCCPQLYMVDRWRCVPHQRGDGSQPQEWHDQNYINALRLVEPFGERAVILRGESVIMATKVANHSLLLVYVDADHSFEGVMRDILAWEPKLVPGGYMAFHDYQNPSYGVKQAVQSYCSRRGLTIHEIPENALKDAGAYFSVC